MANNDNLDAGTGSYVAAGSDWTEDENFWRTNYASRPYASSDEGFEVYRSAYHYGHDAARDGGAAAQGLADVREWRRARVGPCQGRRARRVGPRGEAVT
jgi:hypothetical protein